MTMRADEQPERVVVERREDVPPSTMFLQPTAGPSILGLSGLAAPALLVGARYAGWFGTAASPSS